MTLQENADKLRVNIMQAIRKLQNDGTVAMSVDNLKQITPTTGLTCAPSAYHGMFNELAHQAAQRLMFKLY